MLTVFNRKELLRTVDPALRLETCMALKAAGIPYRIRAFSSELRSRQARSWNFGASHPTEYRVFVRRCDYEAALLLIQK